MIIATIVAAIVIWVVTFAIAFILGRWYEQKQQQKRTP